MNPWAILGVVLAVIATAGGAYLKGGADARNACEAEAARDERVAQQATASAAAAAASAISSIGVQHVRVTQQLEREVREVPVYRECRATAAGLRDINAALTGAEPEPAGGVAVSAASAPD